MSTECKLIPEESNPQINRFVFSCIKIPWNSIKVKVCAYDSEDSAKNFAEGEVENLISPPKDNLINYCGT
jgi:hypothetical protein